MKKLILFILLISAPCYADMTDFFKHMNTADTTNIVKPEKNQIYGFYTQPIKEFMFDANQYFKEKGSIVKDWEKIDTDHYCTGVMVAGKIYAICVQENIVAIQPLTLDQ